MERLVISSKIAQAFENDCYDMKYNSRQNWYLKKYEKP